MGKFSSRPVGEYQQQYLFLTTANVTQLSYILNDKRSLPLFLKEEIMDSLARMNDMFPFHEHSGVILLVEPGIVLEDLGSKRAKSV